MRNTKSSSDDTVLKRFPIKYIRDRAKSAYKKEKECYICGAKESLDLHHFNSISQLFIKWSNENSIVIKELSDILGCRDAFIEAHKPELYDLVRTLCKKHHKQLHSIYGQHPKLTTVDKQEAWCNKQYIKHQG